MGWLSFRAQIHESPSLSSWLSPPPGLKLQVSGEGEGGARGIWEPRNLLGRQVPGPVTSWSSEKPLPYHGLGQGVLREGHPLELCSGSAGL